MPKHLSNLGNSQQLRFLHLGILSDLDGSTTNIRKAVQLTHNSHPTKLHRLSSLGINQQIRFNRLGELSDLDASIKNLGNAVKITDDVHQEQPINLLNLGNTL